MGRFRSAVRRSLRPRTPVDPALGARPRGRFGMWGPVPHYTRRTRSGAQVSVGGCGCCLPIPLAVGLATAGALRAVGRRLR
jgi:hypothetical protein